ncbi:hypothetical protein V6U71_21320 [Sphingopyxis sp. J-6]|uniref:hypothetical protein n=1 Tax=Sphingopyxis sp. J-6 TaxID=3122054 RepID=UPI003984254C
MASISRLDAEGALWRTAIKDALGPLSAFLTPENFGLSSVGLEAKHDVGDAFRTEIERRIDLARAAAVIEIVDEIGDDLPHTYRHDVKYCDDKIDGVLLIPRLIRERSAGRSRIPVLRASRFSETPEALLISESLRVSVRVASTWRDRGGAEGILSDGMLRRLAVIEARQPWSSLRARSRPALRSLASAVSSRAVAGWHPPGGPLDRLARLVLDGANSVSDAAGLIAFLVSQDRRFEDRMFELVSLGWLLGALSSWDPSGRIFPHNLRSSGPIFIGSRGGLKASLHYQAGYLSASARYSWRRSGRNLRAIPDFSLELQEGDHTTVVILDAKNRSESSNSEIAYKMLGYRENLGSRRFLAVAIAPTFGTKRSLDGVHFGERSSLIMRLPLETGRAELRRFALRSLEKTFSPSSIGRDEGATVD